MERQPAKPRPALAVSLYVAGKVAVVVGDGPPCEERAQRLLDAGARVRPVPAAAYEASLLDGAHLVLCCERALGAQVAADARSRGALVYVLDEPHLSDLAMPALARRGPLQIAVATDGAAPALSARLRAELARLLDAAGPALDELVADMAQLRASSPPGAARREALSTAARRLSLSGHLEIRGAGERDPKI